MCACIQEVARCALWWLRVDGERKKLSPEWMRTHTPYSSSGGRVEGTLCDDSSSELCLGKNRERSWMGRAMASEGREISNIPYFPATWAKVRRSRNKKMTGFWAFILGGEILRSLGWHVRVISCPCLQVEAASGQLHMYRLLYVQVRFHDHAGPPCGQLFYPTSFTVSFLLQRDASPNPSADINMHEATYTIYKRRSKTFLNEA